MKTTLHALVEQGRFVAAAATAEKLVRRSAAPDHDLLQLSACLLQAVAQHDDRNGRENRQLRLVTAAADRCPHNPALAYNAAVTHLNLGKHQKALQWADRCIAAAGSPTPPKYLSLRARCLTALGRYSESTPTLSAALAQQPDDHETLSALASALKESGRGETAINLLAKAAHTAPHVRQHFEGLCMATLAVTDDPSTIRSLHQEYGRRIAAVIPETFTPPPSTATNRPLRVGFVSSDFRFHSCATFLLPLIEELRNPRHNIHTVCVMSHSRCDAMTDRFRDAAHQWASVALKDTEKAVPIVRGLNLDLLIDCNGLTSGQRLDLFAARCAPKQATFMGYPATTGLPTIDLRFVDHITDPEHAGFGRYSTETLLHLHTLWCFNPPDNCPEPHAAMLRQQETRPFTFGVFNSATKFTKASLDLWANCLIHRPDSRIAFKATAWNDDGTWGWLRSEFERRGVSPDRLIRFPYTATVAEHLRLYQHIDLQLDTAPYNGTTTTAESLYMGVPVVTAIGASHAARTTASMLHTTGFPHLIAYSPDDYIRIATQTGFPHRASVRAAVAASPLMNRHAYATDFSSVVRRALGAAEKGV